MSSQSNNISFSSFPSTSDSCSWSPPTDIAELADGANDDPFPTDAMLSSSTTNKGSVSVDEHYHQILNVSVQGDEEATLSNPTKEQSKDCQVLPELTELPSEALVSPTGMDDFEAERVTASTKFQFSDALASSFESDFTRLFDDAEFTLTDKEETGKERKTSNASLEQHLAYLSNTMKEGKMQIKLNPSQLVHSLLATPTKKQEVDPTTSNSLEVSFSSQAYGPLMSCGTKDGMFAISCHQNAAVGVRSILQGFMPQIGTLADAVSEGYDMLASEFPEYLKPKSDVTDDA